jgi:hypothetical protein
LSCLLILLFFSEIAVSQVPLFPEAYNGPYRTGLLKFFKNQYDAYFAAGMDEAAIEILLQICSFEKTA